MPAPILPPASAWLPLDRAAGKLEQQIHAAIRDRILDGRLRPGERLPSSRALARSLGLARSTVVGGFERLRAEGFVRGHPGSAMRVADLSAPPAGARVEARAETQSGSARAHVPDEPERFLPFRPGLPDLDSFPHATWARCLAARARAPRIHDLGYGEENGLAELRHAILRHVVRARAVLADPEQVVVMPSAASILSMLSRVERVGPDRPVWLEEPAYGIARETFRAAGAALVPVPCDEEGIAIGRAEGHGPPPCLVYVTPSHQYPTGVSMSLPRRLKLLEFAASVGAVVIEDDYDSEFHYASRPLAALQGIDRAGCVAYVGTFSKVLAPALRVAYAVLPPRLVGPVRAVLRREGGSVPIHVQAALADFLNEGHLRAHIRRMHAVYEERMRATRDALRDVGGGLFEVGSGSGGLQLPIWFRDQADDDDAWARALHAQGLGPMALSPFHISSPRPGLLFGIGAATEERIARLKTAIGRHRPA
ncbi:PLP-dependent aminotransferase family protein [Antarcticirhabdus aurantiaca]|uniref:PLP-dependent aminotransferase family protein n=1 Tax=Antarcticirhabdus aurantiaca TaxID=2606717 RepID=A0ACD4NMW0_9HYPH|nr:PLP-dependent aminotransferase family protein [Antarcticirhabdus aurantiaca]WAJ28300.1 PLP-dependent aminotransferase family protein [Jeongeuplla avenae]